MTTMELLLISPVASGLINSNNPSIIGHAVMLVFPLVKAHKIMQVALVDQLFIRLLISYHILYMPGERHEAKVPKKRQRLYVQLRH